MLNRMCTECKRLGQVCTGTENEVWSNCVYKETRVYSVEQRRYLNAKERYKKSNCITIFNSP